jgi:hypothetical protein
MTRTVYQIKDTAGRLIAEHGCERRQDGTKSMWWTRPGIDPKLGLDGYGTANLPLYGSERLADLAPGTLVLACEGEKATEAAWSLGYAAVGTVTGASGTPGEDALSVLLPFDVVTWEDHDEPGEQHMRRGSAGLLRLGGGARRLVWGREKGDDAADFVARGGARVTADLLVRGATPWRFEPADFKVRQAPRYDRHDGADRVSSARSHLVQVVVQKLGEPVKHEHRSLWWSCPFHAERTASFKVDLHEPYYRCFGCGERGDVFTFLRSMEGQAFKDALRELAPPRLLGAAIPW